jgi:hypothetical protein
VIQSVKEGFAIPVVDLALSVGDERLDLADLILLGLLRGTWQDFERDVRLGVGLERDSADAVGGEEVRAAASAFRYRHRLLSGTDFKAWLDERSLSVGEFSGVLRRSLLRERLGGGDAPPARSEDVASVLWSEAVCNGVLRELADAGASCLVAAQIAAPQTDGSPEAILAVMDWVAARDGAGLAALGEESLRVRLERLVGCESALRWLEGSLAQEGALERRLADHGLDWVRLDGQELSFYDEDAAREARLLLTEDRVAVAEVEKRAGIVAHSYSLYLEEVDEDEMASFAAAAPGEVIGPWRSGERWRVLQLTERRRPSLEDPILLGRATVEALAELINRRAAGRVQRYVSL